MNWRLGHMGKFDFDSTTLGDVMNDAEGNAVLEKHIPKILKSPIIGIAKKKSLTAVFQMAKGQVDEATAATIRTELEAL